MALSPKVLARVEERMQVIQENAYASALANIWWPKIAKERPSTASAEKLYLLMTGGAMDYGVEGTREFMEQTISRMDLTPKFFTAPGLEILRSELEDSDGAGFQKASQWAGDTAVKGALFPQHKLAAALLANPLCYDGQNFFDTDHPLLPGDPDSGTWKNDLTGSADGDYPGAVPLTGDAATANANLAKALAYIRTIKGPDGVTCLNLEPVALLGSPTIHRLALVAAKAQFIGGTAGSTDISALVNDFGVDLIRAGELAGDTSYYIMCRQAGTEVGPWIWLNRESPNVAYHGPQTDAQLARMDKFQWGVRGRGVIAPGRPHFMFRCKAT
jgi:phage major head subunit gpT-like protein